jgi:hypothetical protein
MNVLGGTKLLKHADKNRNVKNGAEGTGVWMQFDTAVQNDRKSSYLQCNCAVYRIYRSRLSQLSLPHAVYASSLMLNGTLVKTTYL